MEVFCNLQVCHSCTYVTYNLAGSHSILVSTWNSTRCYWCYWCYGCYRVLWVLWVLSGAIGAKMSLNYQTPLPVRGLVQTSSTQRCTCCQPSWMPPGFESRLPLWTILCPTRSQPPLDALGCPPAASSKILPWSYSRPSQWDCSSNSSSVGCTSSPLLHQGDSP